MENMEVSDIIDRAEDSKIQLKQDISNAVQLASEMVAFSNARGGVIIIGVSKTKDITGLSDKDIERINQLISNASDQNVRPPIAPFTEVIKIGEKKVIALEVGEGINKPYSTNEGIFWTKKGSDKRKLSREELQRLFQDSSRMYADEQIVRGSSVRDIYRSFFEEFYENDYKERVEDSELPLERLLENIRLAEKSELRLGGLLLFGRNPQVFKPAFHVKAVSFYGDEPEGTEFRDSEDIKGNLSRQYKDTLGFLLRNIKKIQKGTQFNQQGELEIPRQATEELLVNALIHRDYYINAPIIVFIFDNRIEISSPGRLPNNLTVEHIKKGISVVRNPILHSFGSRMLPYRGVGTGIRRAIKIYPNIEFENNEETERFKVIIRRQAFRAENA